MISVLFPIISQFIKSLKFNSIIIYWISIIRLKNGTALCFLSSHFLNQFYLNFNVIFNKKNWISSILK